MSTSNSIANVRLVKGDLLHSNMHALVNTVNTVGIMGKGIAAAFKRKYPAMFRDYVRRCDAGEVRLGHPYPYDADDHLIINFPTKKHWRSVSRLDDIIAGLNELERSYKTWGVRSIAVPPLGCGNGQLEWSVVGPVLIRHLARLDIPVELYIPHDAEGTEEQLQLLSSNEGRPRERHVDAWLVALAEIVDRLESQPYHYPVGRILFQKIAYFATMAGIDTGLEYSRSNFGPFASALKPAIARMQNNGLIREEQHGQAFEVHVGETLADARASYSSDLQKWAQPIDRTYDLVARMTARDAEVAATIHYCATSIATAKEGTPRASEIIDMAQQWKVNRKPPISRIAMERATVFLAMRRWIQVEPDDSIASAMSEVARVESFC
jgi:O-acetyl-ADP-ribose deacetylase (regulator of RNase III)/uncharacterized protein YwgA